MVRYQNIIKEGLWLNEEEDLIETKSIIEFDSSFVENPREYYSSEIYVKKDRDGYQYSCKFQL